MSYRESTYNQLKESIEILDSLPIDNPDNAIWWCLHQVVWHLGIDRARWITGNKSLLTRIAQQKNIPDTKLLKEFRESILKLKPDRIL
jgi:hypothetical protein